MTSTTANRLPSSSSSSSSSLLYKTLLGEVKEYGNSTIPFHLQRRSTDNDILVSSVVSLVQGDDRRSKKMTKGPIDVAKVNQLTDDVPKSYAVGYWRRWYDDLTVLEQVIDSY